MSRQYFVKNFSGNLRKSFVRKYLARNNLRLTFAQNMVSWP